jgi:hypothetical protein
MTGNNYASDLLERALSDVGHTHDTGWQERIVALLRGREVYLHFTGEAVPGGQPSMMTSAANGRDGWILTYTSRRRSGITYGGIRWEELETMIGKLAAAPGVRVVNDNDDWVVLSRDALVRNAPSPEPDTRPRPIRRMSCPGRE